MFRGESQPEKGRKTPVEFVQNNKNQPAADIVPSGADWCGRRSLAGERLSAAYASRRKVTA